MEDLIKEMNEDIIRTIDTADKIRKHKSALKLCENYLNVLQYTPNEDLAYEANQYATEIYNDIMGKEPEIAIENTCFFPHNVDIVTGAKDNLRAVIKMLKEVLVKETKEETENIHNTIN